MGSSPARFPALSFFTHFFSSHSSYWKTIKKIFFYFFYFLVEPNKFIKIYFIIFFSSFTHCKTSKFFFSSHHFFSYVLFTKHTITQFIQHMITQFIHNNSCYAHHLIIKHNACSVLILSRDCLGNHIPKLYIEPHQVMVLSHLNDHGLSSSPLSPRYSYT